MKQIIIPTEFMGVSVSKQTMDETLHANNNQPISNQPQPANVSPASNNLAGKDRYIILPSQTHGNHQYPDLLVSMDRTHLNKNWDECWNEVRAEGGLMLPLREYVDFINLIKSGQAFDGNGKAISGSRLDALYKDITEVRAPWRGEHIDAKFESKGKKLYLLSHKFESGNLIESKYPLEDCLISDKTAGIDLDDWLVRANRQGLPPSNVKDGKLYYWYPRDKAVARFSADSDRAFLSCIRYSSYRVDWLGVRFARLKN